MSLFLLGWNLFQTYTYMTIYVHNSCWLVVFGLQELHVLSRLGSSTNLPFECDLTLAWQLFTRHICSVISPAQNFADTVKILQIRNCYFNIVKKLKKPIKSSFQVSQDMLLSWCMVSKLKTIEKAWFLSHTWVLLSFEHIT